MYFEGINDFFLVPINKKNNITEALIVIKRLAFVKERLIDPKLISGPSL